MLIIYLQKNEMETKRKYHGTECGSSAEVFNASSIASSVRSFFNTCQLIKSMQLLIKLNLTLFMQQYCSVLQNWLKCTHMSQQ